MRNFKESAEKIFTDFTLKRIKECIEIVEKCHNKQQAVYYLNKFYQKAKKKIKTK